MARNIKTRADGIKLGRLPGYSVVTNPMASDMPGAIALRDEMHRFVTIKAAVRVNGGKSSHSTIQKANDILGELCLRLWRLGFHVRSIDNINPKHIQALIRDHWANGASPKHLTSILTQLNKFDDWIKKPGMVKSKEVYLPEVDHSELQVKTVADKSKSWTENGVSILQKIAEADQKDWRFGLMLRMCAALGLRRCEVLQIKPWGDDKGTYFDIRPGIAKGGRARTIPYLDPAQKQVVAYVQSQIKKNEHLGWVDERKSEKGLLKQNGKKYDNLMSAIGITKADAGVTGHGLRAEYAEDMAILLGLIPATRGGTKGQMDKESEDLVRLKVSESLGHSRLNVTNAYIGSLTKKIQNSRGDRIGSVILGGRKTASIYMNPPPKLGLGGAYQRLSKRNIDGTDIQVVIEDAQDGLSVPIAEFSFKDDVSVFQSTMEELPGMGLFESEEDSSNLKRIGSVLLAKFGVVTFE